MMIPLAAPPKQQIPKTLSLNNKEKPKRRRKMMTWWSKLKS
jgi:hypothetical protein